MWKVEETMTICIVSICGARYNIYAKPSDTISLIKTKISQVSKYHSNIQKLLYKSNELFDNSTLTENGISDKSTVHMITQLRGC